MLDACPPATARQTGGVPPFSSSSSTPFPVPARQIQMLGLGPDDGRHKSPLSAMP
jgi:hypothetical protein